MSAIRRIAYKSTKASKQCLNCKESFLNKDEILIENEVYKCRNCGTRNVVVFSEDGRKVIITDYKKFYLLGGKKNEPGRKHKKI